MLCNKNCAQKFRFFFRCDRRVEKQKRFNLKFKFRVHGPQWLQACSGKERGRHGPGRDSDTGEHLFKASISSLAVGFKFKPLASPGPGRRRPARRGSLASLEVTSPRPTVLVTVTESVA